jgi:glycosyltransferase involved in cell wall biosynthesis
MKILMILQTNFPPDIRVENEIRSLVKAGHTVHLLCKNSGGEAAQKNWEGATIHRIPWCKKIEIMNSFRQFPIHLNPVWRRMVIRLIDQYSIDVVHVHDLPLAPMAVWAKKRYPVKIIYDMHENYPAALKVWQKKGFENLIKNYRIARLIEKKYLPKFDRLIAVIEENKVRVEKIYGYPGKNIAVVSNLVRLEDFVPNNAYSDIHLPEDLKIILYVGGLDSHRGLDVVIRGMNQLISSGEPLYLLIVGGGRYEKTIEELLRDSVHLKGRMHVTGWVPFKYVPWFVSQSDVCVIPQGSNIHTDTTIPHKVFQYCALGKPVVAADAVPMKRIVHDMKAGEIFRSGDIEDFIEKLLRVLQKPDNYGQSGKKAVEEKYNWSWAEKELLRVYSSLS